MAIFNCYVSLPEGIYIWCFLKRGIPETMGFNSKMVIHDLDDLGVLPILGNLHIYAIYIGFLKY